MRSRCPVVIDEALIDQRPVRSLGFVRQSPTGRQCPMSRDCQCLSSSRLSLFSQSSAKKNCLWQKKDKHEDSFVGPCICTGLNSKCLSKYNLPLDTSLKLKYNISQYLEKPSSFSLHKCGQMTDLEVFRMACNPLSELPRRHTCSNEWQKSSCGGLRGNGAHEEASAVLQLWNDTEHHSYSSGNLSAQFITKLFTQVNILSLKCSYACCWFCCIFLTLCPMFCSC